LKGRRRIVFELELDDFRTPWERGDEGAAIVEYERAELEESVTYLRERGYWA
jgi:hypothetical protein